MSGCHEGYTSLNVGAAPCRRCPFPFQIFQFIIEPRPDCRLRQWFLAFTVLLVFHLYYNMVSNHNKIISANKLRLSMDKNATCSNITPPVPVYKYPLINSSEVVMTYGKKIEGAYWWFAAMRDSFVNLGKDEDPHYLNNTRGCILYMASLGPIYVDKNPMNLGLVEDQLSDVKRGGFYAPKHCRSKYRVAIIVALCKKHKLYLSTFLFYIHRLLKIQLVAYRIFVIEPFGNWNKGLLYNIAYLESQRFGTWDCLVFHDVNLIPVNEKIIYGCTKDPVQLVSAVDYMGDVYTHLFGGVTAITPIQFETVNGYSNLFWNTEGVEEDMRHRFMSADYSIKRYRTSSAVYTSLTPKIAITARMQVNSTIRHRFHFEGLWKTRYSLVNVTKEKLYTHIVANISPETMKLNYKDKSKQTEYSVISID